MRRKILKIVALILGVLVLGFAGLTARAVWIFDRTYADVPELDVVADHSQAAAARGEMLFESLCMECHGGPGGLATGKHLAEIPGFFGTFYSSNLAHPDLGVHKRSDRALARTLRTGVLPDGRFSFIMSMFKNLGDRDIAAIIGYLRSAPPALVPGGEVQPSSKATLAAKILLTLSGMNVDVTGGLVPVPVPKREPSVEYGRYMAVAMDCVGCHTEGMAPSAEKLQDPGAFAGGVELTDPTGTAIWSRNITFELETGIGHFTLEDFERALTRGERPDGYLVRKPMPLFARFDRVEVLALYRFLQTMPKVHRPNTPGGHRLRKAAPDDSAADLFVNVGCVACHGPGAPHQQRLQGAYGKPDDEVAAWILDPQEKKPGSAMPSFRHALDLEQARSLAKYVKGLSDPSRGETHRRHRPSSD